MRSSLLSLVGLVILVGCATPISDPTLDRIETAAIAAAEVGVSADLIASKGVHRPFIVAIQKQLEDQVATGRITSPQLANIIVGKLPLDSTAAQYYAGTVILWGVTSGSWVAPNFDDAVMRVAKGLITGIQLGLDYKPSVLAAKARREVPPTPSKSNVIFASKK